MRLQANDDEILRSQFGGVVGAAGMHDALFITNQQFEAVGTHRGQVSAARDQADIGSRERQLHAEIAADRAGAVDTDFHAVLQDGWPETASFMDIVILSASRSVFFQGAPVRALKSLR